jgi:hypothetical protein
LLLPFMSVCSDVASVLNCIEAGKVFQLANSVTELNLCGLYCCCVCYNAHRKGVWR